MIQLIIGDNMRNNKAMIAIIGLLLLISIGYTLLTSNLSINGTTKIDGVI